MFQLLLTIALSFPCIQAQERPGVPDVATVTQGSVASTVLGDGVFGVVTVDADRPGAKPDGRIDEAVVLQFAPDGPPVSLPSGHMTVTIKRSMFTLTDRDGRGIVFTVTEPGATSAKEDGVTSVAGLARYRQDGRWTHQQFVDRMTFLAAGQGQPVPLRPDCEPCQAGGVGSTGCSISCLGGPCSVSCSEGYYACCKCSDIIPRCLCCREEATR